MGTILRFELLNLFGLNDDNLSTEKKRARSAIISVFNDHCNTETNNGILDGTEIDAFLEDLAKKAPNMTKTVKKNLKNLEERSSFGNKTRKQLHQNIKHKTKLLDIAEKHLGLYEVTLKEAEGMPKDILDKETQMHVIGEYGVSGVNDQWCAHTASHITEEAGIDIGGHKASVQAFIDWANNKEIWKPIKTKKMTTDNYKAEYKSREEEIELQFSKIKEGDLIVWKSQYIKNVKDIGLKSSRASHIGIIEKVDLKHGTITVIEGNANETYKPKGYDAAQVKTKEEGTNGHQDIGESVEINRRDGLIRKTYTIAELARGGYSGYIDMQKLVG